MRDELLDLQAGALGRRLRSSEMAAMEIRRHEAGRELVITKLVAPPRSHRVTVRRNTRALYSEGFDGEAAWAAEGDGRARPVTHPIAAAALAREGLWLAGRRSLKELDDLGVQVEFLPGERDATGRVLPAFRVHLDPSASKLVFVEPATGRIRVERDELADGDETTQRLELHTLDSAGTDGMSFPTRQLVVDVDTGSPVAELRWISVEILPLRADRLEPLRA